MDCKEIKESLPAFQDGEPAAIPAAEIEAHLAGCGPCRAEAEALQQAWTLFKSQYPPAELPAELAVEEPAFQPAARFGWVRTLIWAGAAAALAAALYLPARKMSAARAAAEKRAPLGLEEAAAPAMAEWSLTRRRAPEKIALAWAREIGGAPE